MRTLGLKKLPTARTWLSALSLSLAFVACSDDTLPEDTLQPACQDGETRHIACGDDDAGTQAQLCVDSAWTNDGDCEIPTDGCTDGDTRTLECGDDHEGEQSQICEDGAWGDSGDCVLPNETCVDGETREQACDETQGLSGVQIEQCHEEHWQITQECERGSVTVAQATITVKKPRDADGNPTGAGVWAANVLNGDDPPALRNFDLQNLEITTESGRPVALEIADDDDTVTAALHAIENEDGTTSDLRAGVYIWTLNDEQGSPIAGSSFTIRSSAPEDTAFQLSGLSVRINEPAQIDMTDEQGRAVTPAHTVEEDDLTRHDFVTISAQIYSYEAIAAREDVTVMRGRKFSPDRLLVTLTPTARVALPIQVTKGAHFEAFRKVADNPVSPEHYIEFLPIDFEVDDDLSNDAYDGYILEAPSNVLFHVEASIPGQTVKHVEMFRLNATPDDVKIIDLEDLDETMVGDNGYKEADILTNTRDSHVVSLALQGEGRQEFALDIFRVWQAMRGDSSNYFVDPNYLIQTAGDAATAENLYTPGRAQARIEAQKPGVSVVTIGYEPIHIFDTFSFAMWGAEPAPPGQNPADDFFNAIAPANLGVVIVQVGEENADEIEMNIDTTVFDTFYFPREEGHASFTFTPTANNDLEVCVHTPLHVAQWSTDWHCFDANDDESFTIELTEGRNIVRAKTENSEQFYVLRARPVDLAIENADDPDAEIRVGDPVRITIQGLQTPVPKLSNVYNPGVGNSAYVTYDLDGEQQIGNKTQYAISNHGVLVLDGFEDAGEYTLENGRIHLNVTGQKPGAHRGISRGGSRGGYTGGDETVGPYYGALPNITFEVH